MKYLCTFLILTLMVCSTAYSAETQTKQVAEVKPQVPLHAANVSAEVIASKPDQNTVGSTGLTATETAYLSNEEKAMRLKSKGLA